MSRLVLIIVVEAVAFVLAIFAALSFFSDQPDVGLVAGLGTWALVWWGKYALTHG